MRSLKWALVAVALAGVALASAYMGGPGRRVLAADGKMKDGPRPSTALRGNTHGHMGFNARNVARGRLAVVGTLQIGKANRVRPGMPDKEFVVDVTIWDEDDNLVIDHDTIGRGVDRDGVGGWEQDFRALYWREPGNYRVEMMAHIPTQVVIQLNGDRTPRVIASASRTIRVR